MVYKAQELVLKGRFKKICELQQCAIEFFTNNGVRSNYLHNLGHSIGYSVHEYPYLNDTDDSALVDNIILTIEPGLYFKGDFGIRIEDMVVSCGGRLKPFSSSSKEVICLEIK
jgi:Xaa-Pro aminopeptidase